MAYAILRFAKHKGGSGLGLRRFSREHAYRRCQLARGLAVLSGLGSGRGFACAPPRLHPSTRYSVSARACHFSVSPSQPVPVAEY